MPGDAMRIASANTYDNAMQRLMQRQSQLSKLQDQLSAGKKVLRPSDDPAAAAQAERAFTRLARVAADQRALEVQRNAMTSAEAALGHAGDALQQFRALLVQSGNGTLSATDRASIAQQMQGLRDQVLALANARDSNELPLFAGLGSGAQPFADHAGSVAFDGIAGQPAAGDAAIPAVLDGHATFMAVPGGNGVFSVAQASGTSGVHSDAGQVRNPSALTGHDYRIEFDASGRYDVIDSTSGAVLQSAQPYQSGQTIEFDGIALVVSGMPAAGEALEIKPSVTISLFDALDQAAAGVRDSASGAALAQTVAQSLAQLDAGMARLSASRARAGEWLNRADGVGERQSARGVQLEADRSRAEDLDVVQAISDFQNQQAGYSAALGAYAQIRRLSLFDFLR